MVYKNPSKTKNGALKVLIFWFYYFTNFGCIGYTVADINILVYFLWPEFIFLSMNYIGR